MHRFEWFDDPGIEFHISHGERLRLLRECGFAIEDLIELQPHDEAEETRFPFVELSWARQWPGEEAWVARRTG